VEEQRYNEEHADRQSNTSTNAAAKAAEDKRMTERDAEYEKDRADENLRRKAVSDAQIKSETDRDNMIKGIMKPEGENAAPGNQDSVNPDQRIQPTVPGGPMAPGHDLSFLQEQAPSGTQQPNAGQAPSASGPGMQGQAPQAFQTPSIADGLNIGSLLSSSPMGQNQMQQGVGQQGGSPLTGVPANPLGMSNSPATASAYSPPPSFDPRVMMAAYALARAKGQPQGIGGTPGAGGLPLGYG
jgi:hypothetical protein